MKPQARPEDHPGHERDRDRDDRRAVAQLDADDDRAEGAHQELALHADVEQAGLEAEADGEAAEQQRHRVVERVDDRPFRTDRPGHERPVRVERQPELSSPVTSHCEKMMTSEPTMTDRTIEMTGKAAIDQARLS